MFGRLGDGGSLLRAIEVAMQDADRAPRAGEPGGEAFGGIDRTVPAAGAAERDGEIAFALGLIAGHRLLWPIAQLLETRVEIGIGFDEGPDLGIAAGEFLQGRNVMRIPEEAHIEDQVGVARQAVAMRKRGDENGVAGRGVEPEITLQQALQVRRRQRRGVDHQIGAVAQGPDALAFQAYAVGHRMLGRQRMAAAGFGITAFQPVVVAIEEHHAQIDGLALDQPVERLDQRGHGEVARADIDADGKRRLHRVRTDEIGQQRQRQIVHRLVAHILERLQGGGSPRARHAGDDHETAALMATGGVHGRTSEDSTARISSPARTLSAKRSLAAAEASKGASAIRGIGTPRMSQLRRSGRRSICSAGTRSTTRRKHALAWRGSCNNPTPRASIMPARASGARITTSSPSRARAVWSSATSAAPWSIRRSARSDLPAPEGPRSKTPARPNATAVPWTRLGGMEFIGRFRCAALEIKSMVWRCTGMQKRESVNLLLGLPIRNPSYRGHRQKTNESILLC